MFMNHLSQFIAIAYTCTVTLIGSECAAQQQVHRCVVDGRVQFQDIPCPTRTESGAEDASTKKRPDAVGRLQAEQARRREDLQRDFTAPSTPAAGEKSSLTPSPGLSPDCVNLSLYAKAKGHNFIERAEIVQNARNNGLCR